MRVGILETTDDEFCQELATRLADLRPEFIRPAEMGIPTNWDFRVMVDRISFHNPFLREIMKNLSLHGTYVINNPFASQAMNKLVDLNACHLLGIPYPRTIALPCVRDDPEFTTPPHLDEIMSQIGLPCVVKPYNGYGWSDVFVADKVSEVENLYDALRGRHVLLVQEYIDYRDYCRAYCVGGEVQLVKYRPKKNAWEYSRSDLAEIDGLKDRLMAWTKDLNRALDIDVNAVEWAIDKEGRPFVIDAFNEVPEITRAIPEPYYEWILDRFAGLVRRRMASDDRNLTPFLLKDLSGRKQT
jgi:glutathione synthase/RimK-type ligase-like ATP-grasp enzyme